jgi:hypothetical protein
VRTGSFSCRVGRRDFELVPGAFLIGRRDDEYICAHDHSLGGDECLSFKFCDELAESLSSREEFWRRVYVQPLADFVVLGQLAQSFVERGDPGRLEEIGVTLGARLADAILDRSDETDVGPRDRRPPCRRPPGSMRTAASR